MASSLPFKAGEHVTGTAIALHIPGLETLGGPLLVRVLTGLHEALRPISQDRSNDGLSVLSLPTGAILVVSDLSQTDVLGFLEELTGTVAEAGVPVRIGLDRGTMAALSDADDSLNFIGWPINAAVHLSQSASNLGVLASENVSTHLSGTLESGHWLHQSQGTIEIPGRSEEVVRCYACPDDQLELCQTIDPERFPAPSQAAESLNAVFLSYELPDFSDNDLAQMRSRFQSITSSFQGLTAQRLHSDARLYLSPGGAGGVLVISHVEPSHGIELARDLREKLTVESLHRDKIIKVEARIGLHYGPVQLYKNARGAVRPAGLNLLAAAAIINDDQARENRGKVIATEPFKDPLSHGSDQHFDNHYRELARAAGPLLADIKRYVQRASIGGFDLEVISSQPFARTLGEQFVGRSNLLASLKARLDEKQQATLTGMAGVGKTRLAIEFIHKHQKDYPGGIFWLEADSPEHLQSEMYDLLIKLDASLAAHIKPGDSEAVRQQWARRLSDRRAKGEVLWCLNNLWEPPPGESPPELLDLCPAPDRTSVLITSRLRYEGDQRPWIQLLEVPVLEPSAAAELLNEGVEEGLRLDPEEAKEVAEWVGGLPIALEILNAGLLRRSFSRATLLARCRSDTPLERLDAARTALKGQVVASALVGVSEAFDLSYQSLDESARTLARLLSFLAPHPIPYGLLDALDAGDAERVALLQRNILAVGVGDYYGQLHRLMREFLQGLESQESKQRKTLEVGVVKVFQTTDLRDPDQWERLGSYAIHGTELLGKIQAWEESTIDLGTGLGIYYGARGQFAQTRRIEEKTSEQASAVLGNQHPRTLNIINNLATTLNAQGNLRCARDLQQKNLEVMNSLAGEEHNDTLTSMNNLAATLRDLGDLREACDLQQRALEISKRVFGEQHPNTLASMINLASILYTQGDLREARNLQQRALEISKRVFGKMHSNTLASMNGLALTLKGLGYLKDAYELQITSLKVRQQAFGKEHPDTLKSMNNLATTLHDLGDIQGACDLLHRVLEVRKRTLGEEHLSTLTSMNNLGELLRSQGDLQGARDLQQKVLDVRERLLGEEHPDTLATMNNLAGTLSRQGDLQNAHDLQERVLEVSKRVLGDEHPNTLSTMNNLASTLEDQKDLEGAYHLYQATLEIRKRIFGESHPDTLSSMNGLASTLKLKGDLTNARDLQQKVLMALMSLLGEEHPNTLTSMNNLASTLSAQGDLQGARDLQQKVLMALMSLLGEEHPNTLTSMNNLASTLSAQGDLQGARDLQQKVLKARKLVLGEEHPDTLSSMNNLAGTLYAQGDLLGAKDLQQIVLKALTSLLGEEHPSTLTSMNNLASILQAQGDLQSAHDFQLRVLEICKHVFGEEHPNTLSAMSNLAETLRTQGNLQEAYNLQQRESETCKRILGEEHPSTLTSINNLALTLRAQGDLLGAKDLQKKVLRGFYTTLGSDHPSTKVIAANLAITLGKLGKTKEANDLWQQSGRSLESLEPFVQDQDH